MLGYLQKLSGHYTPNKVIQYSLTMGADTLSLNALLGKSIQLHFQGKIRCNGCEAAIPKSYNQGYCFLCARKLARCDICIVRPEKCHYAKGTCREPKWGEAHCLKPHIVYLANTSGLKVGITRMTQIPTRWIDQGAVQALPIFKVQTRLSAGLLEVELAKTMADKTNWRKMLQETSLDIDLKSFSLELKNFMKNTIINQESEYLEQEQIIKLEYPVLESPKKIVSLNFNKTPNIQGTLLGIKGQYLILDIGVLNVRNFSGFQIDINF